MRNSLKLKREKERKGGWERGREGERGEGGGRRTYQETQKRFDAKYLKILKIQG